MNQGPEVTVWLFAPAKLLGVILHYLEYEPEISGIEWRQNAPGYSSDVELKLTGTLWPPHWDGAQMLVRQWLQDDHVKSEWQAVLRDADAPDPDHVVVRSMPRAKAWPEPAKSIERSRIDRGGLAS